MAAAMDWSSTEKVDIATNKIQQGFVVISWNVLHMIHEFNYAYDMSPVINRYSIKEKSSNEKLRLNAIVKTLSELLIKNSTIECFICLQEVPGDLLPILREVLDSHVGSTLTSKPLIHTHVYSRKPQVRGRQVDSLYTDPNESLATVHYNPSGMLNEKAAVSEIGEKHLLSDDQISWTPCPTDAGKGALTVTTTSGLSVVNVHVPYDDQPAKLLLSNISWPENNNSFVFVGDMNCSSKTLMSRIAEITNGKPSSGLLFPVTTDKPTRVGLRHDGVLQKSWIDHYVVSASLKDLIMPPVVVYDDIGDISDHYPILLQFKGT